MIHQSIYQSIFPHLGFIPCQQNVNATGKGKYDSTSEEITELEWSYPKLQYEFKVLCLTFKLVKCGNIEAFNEYYKRVSETHGFLTPNANKLSISN